MANLDDNTGVGKNLEDPKPPQVPLISQHSEGGEPVTPQNPPPPPSSPSEFFAETFPSPPKPLSFEEKPPVTPLPSEKPAGSAFTPPAPPPAENEPSVPPVRTIPENPPSPPDKGGSTPAGAPLPPSVSITKPKSLISKLIIPILGIVVLAALGFGIWKFLLPLLPAEIKPGGVTLTYWGLWEDENVLRPILDDYEKSHRGVKIDYKKQNPKEYRERLQAALSSGKGPDVFRFHNTWLPMIKNDLAPVPATVFSTDDFQKTFYPIASEDLKVGSSLYGIPLEIDGLALLYNTDLFKAAQVSPPKTWEEIQRIARIITKKDSQGKIQTAGLALGTTNNVDNWSDILAAMFLQNGVDLKNPQGRMAEDTLTFYTSFVLGENRVWDETLPPSTLAFAQGKVAMIFAPSWQILAVKATNPKLSFKAVSVPQLPKVNVTWASYWVEGVALKSSRQVQAWELLKYLSEKENMTKLYTEAAKTRLFGEPYSRQDLASTLKDDPYLGAYVQQAPQAKSFYLSSRTFDNGINDKIIKYFEDAVNVANQGGSPRSALETAAEGIKQVLSTYNVAVPPSPK